MTALKWRLVSKDTREARADGLYGSLNGGRQWYLLVRENYMGRPVWTAWFRDYDDYDTPERGRRLALRVSYMQARRACIDHQRGAPVSRIRHAPNQIAAVRRRTSK